MWGNHMKIRFLLATSVSALILSACSPTGYNRPWEYNCEKNYSVNTREYLECLDRVKMNENIRTAQKPGSVSLDTRSTEYPDEDRLDRDQDSGSLH